jgi:hypothetical protein
VGSLTVVGVCVRTVGKWKAAGVNLTEKNRNLDALKFTQRMAGSPGFKMHTINISKISACF